MGKAVRYMGYRENMERCLAYINGHPAEEIDPHVLAERSGYSFFHFCHVFRSCCGMPVAEYLRDRRLSKAAVELTDGKRITDAAFDNGFDTVSGFSRAFHHRFGVTPTEYKKKKGGSVKMEPEIKKFAFFTAIGSILKPEKEIDILENGAYWHGKDFPRIDKENYAKLCVPGHGEIGAWLHPADGKKEFYYFFGPMVKDASFLPKGMEVLEVPAAEYAVFPVPKAEAPDTLYEEVNKAWKFIFHDWFDGSGWKFDHTKMDFEYYIDGDAFIYVPVVKA